MASSYLLTRSFVPLPSERVDSVLQRPVGIPSAELRAILDDACEPLRRPAAGSLIHHPDATWLPAHVEFLSRLSCWDLLGLMNVDAANSRRSECITPGGYQRSASDIVWLAFAYADAALAERLAAELADGAEGLFCVGPTGSESERAVLLSRTGQRTMQSSYWYQQHPRRRWLEHQARNTLGAQGWPRWDEQRAAASADSSVRDAWQAFTREQHRVALSRASAELPLALGAHHYTDGRAVYFRHTAGEPPIPLVDADPATFRTIEDFEGFGWYGADGYRLWHFGKPVDCERPTALAPLQLDHLFLTDGVRVYHDGHPLAGIDAGRARAVPGSDMPRGFLHEDTFVVSYGSANLIPVHGASFRAWGGSYYSDQDGVYELHDGELLVESGFDTATFSVIEHHGGVYLRDARVVALARGEGLPYRPLKGAVAATFRGVAGLPFVTDGKHVWLEAERRKDLESAPLRAPPVARCAIPEGIDAESPIWGLCGPRVFALADSGYQWLKGADADSFEMLGSGLARDSKGIWYHGERIAGANAAGFTWIDRYSRRWTDGAGQYFELGHRLEPRRGAAELVQLPVANTMLEVIDREYWLEGIRIEGWHADRQRPGALGCIEDDNYLYSCFSMSAGGVFVWTREYADFPLLACVHDRDRNCWHAAQPVPRAETLATMPRGLLMTREEFDTLFDGLPRGEDYAQVSTTLTEPEVAMTRWRDSRSLNIRGAVSYDLNWTDDYCLETVEPARTPAFCLAVRRALDLFLESMAPLPFADFKAALARVPAKVGIRSFDLDPLPDGARTQIIVQTGSEMPKGVWIDSLRDGSILRMAVWLEDTGFLGTECHSGPEILWAQTNNDGFTSERWTAERRAIFRACVRVLLTQFPSSKSARAPRAARTEPSLTQWCRDSLPQLVGFLVPQLPARKRQSLVKDVRAAADGEEESAAALVWEALLDVLEQQQLLVTFDKQQLLEAVELCRTLATAAGLAGRYEISGTARADSFLDIARDFERWLEPLGHELRWPQGSLRSSGDDLFPTVIVQAVQGQDIDDTLAPLGGGRRFAPTP